jgi:PadR family transcriptional regulator PadR
MSKEVLCERRKIRGASKNTGPHGPENPVRHGTAARVRHRRLIEQVSDGALDLNEGMVYTGLLRLQQQSWVVSKWGTSENNRRSLLLHHQAGREQLERETENWERVAGVMERVLKLQRQG